MVDISKSIVNENHMNSNKYADLGLYKSGVSNRS